MELAMSTVRSYWNLLCVHNTEYRYRVEVLYLKYIQQVSIVSIYMYQASSPSTQ